MALTAAASLLFCSVQWSVHFRIASAEKHCIALSALRLRLLLLLLEFLWNQHWNWCQLTERALSPSRPYCSSSYFEDVPPPPRFLPIGPSNLQLHYHYERSIINSIIDCARLCVFSFSFSFNFIGAFVGFLLPSALCLSSLLLSLLLSFFCCFCFFPSFFSFVLLQCGKNRRERERDRVCLVVAVNWCALNWFDLGWMNEWMLGYFGIITPAAAAPLLHFSSFRFVCWRRFSLLFCLLFPLLFGF